MLQPYIYLIIMTFLHEFTGKSMLGGLVESYLSESAVLQPANCCCDCL